MPYAVRAAALPMLLLMPAALLGQTPSGGIFGTVTDRAAIPLPGVTVSVTPADGWTRQAITDANGRYVVFALPDGSYVVSADLAGFKLPTARVSVLDGRATDANFVLEVACMVEDITVDGGFTANVRDASVIAHIRIRETTPPYECEESCVCTDHRVELVRVAKNTDRVKSGSTLIVTQGGAGRLPDNPRAMKEPPYAVGQELVAFLYKIRRFDKYGRSKIYLFQVNKGIVEFKRTDAPNLSDGMRVDAFMRRLGEFVRGLR